MSTSVHNRRREAFLKAQRQAAFERAETARMLELSAHFRHVPDPRRTGLFAVTTACPDC